MLTAVVLIDDFQARSSDELSLSKGDRVELLESDDEFGDGWYLGRHLISDNTGLFPEGEFPTPFISPIALRRILPPSPAFSRPLALYVLTY